MLSACKFECTIADLQEDDLVESFPDKGGESDAGFKQNRGESEVKDIFSRKAIYFLISPHKTRKNETFSASSKIFKDFLMFGSFEKRGKLRLS